MSEKNPKIMHSPLSKCWYLVTKYKVRKDGSFEAVKKIDISEELGRIITAEIATLKGEVERLEAIAVVRDVALANATKDDTITVTSTGGDVQYVHVEYPPCPDCATLRTRLQSLVTAGENIGEWMPILMARWQEMGNTELPRNMREAHVAKALVAMSRKVDALSAAVEQAKGEK